jgi:hypothetical protein
MALLFSVQLGIVRLSMDYRSRKLQVLILIDAVFCLLREERKE